MLDGLKVLCFDLDDTFWDIRRVLERAEQRVAHFLGERYPKLARHSRSDLLAARMALAREMPERAHDLTWLRTETLRRLAVDDGYPDHVGAEAFDVFIAARNEVELFPDVRPALERLAARYTLATFSNGNADLDRIGLAPMFSVSLNAERVGRGEAASRGLRRRGARTRLRARGNALRRRRPAGRRRRRARRRPAYGLDQSAWRALAWRARPGRSRDHRPAPPRGAARAIAAVNPAGMPACHESARHAPRQPSIVTTTLPVASRLARRLRASAPRSSG